MLTFKSTGPGIEPETLALMMFLRKLLKKKNKINKKGEHSDLLKTSSPVKKKEKKKCFNPQNNNKGCVVSGTSQTLS